MMMMMMMMIMLINNSHLSRQQWLVKVCDVPLTYDYD